MAIETHIHDGTAWRKAKEIYCHDGTEWRKAKKIYAHDGSAWRLVFGAGSWERQGDSVNLIFYLNCALGEFAINSSGSVLKLLSGTWTSTGLNQTATKLGYDSGDVFALTTNNGAIYKYNGTSWSLVTSLSYGMQVLPDNVRYLDTRIYEHDGTQSQSNPYIGPFSFPGYYYFIAPPQAPYNSQVYKNTTGTTWAAFAPYTTGWLMDYGSDVYSYYPGDPVYKFNGSTWVDQGISVSGLFPFNSSLYGWTPVSIYDILGSGETYTHTENIVYATYAGTDLYICTTTGVYKWVA